MAVTKRKVSKCSIACLRCRTRKIKCDRMTPCKNCTAADTKCEKSSIDLDGRKKRYRNLYVKALECQVETLESVVSSLVHIKDLVDKDHANYSPFNKNEESQYQDGEMKANRILSNNSEILLEDKTNISIYEDIVPPMPKAAAHLDKNAALANYEELETNKDIAECLDNFFTWQYFDMNFYVDRKRFFKEFHRKTEGETVGEFCSEDLIYALSAIGAKLSSNEELQKKSTDFYTAAKKIIFSEKYLYPCSTTIQSLLYLSVYDNTYNDSSCWMLSGLAFRMGLHLGFDRLLYKETSNSMASVTIKAENRVFWGCFIYDHYNSLLLGRPVTFKSSASLREFLSLEREENFSEKYSIDNTTFVMFKMIELFTLLEPFVQTLNLADETDNKTVQNLESLLRTQTLNNINLQLMRWKNDIEFGILWNKDSANSTDQDLSMLALNYYYYLTVLCINRPFAPIKTGKASISKEIRQSLEYSTELSVACIKEVVASLRVFSERMQSFKYLTVTMIYTIVLSLNYILLCDTNVMVNIEGLREDFEYLLSVLKTASNHWKTASRSYELILTKMRQKYPSYYEEMFKLKSKLEATRSQSNDTQCNYDFSEYSGIMEDYNVAVPSTADSILDTHELWNNKIDFRALDFLDANITSWSHVFPDLYK